MPRIIVQSDPLEGNGGVVTMAERVLPGDLESDHFSAQLIERVGWAVVDANEAEREKRSERETQPA
jgi:hypothetical protein